MQDTDLFALIDVAHSYFYGLHNADVPLLRSLFHPDCVLKAPSLRRDREQWLALVGSRPVPAHENAPYEYRILHIDILGEQAMIKVFCPLLGAPFIDFLGLLKEQGNWLIVNKMYADMPANMRA